MKTSLREHHTDKDFGPLFTGELLRDEGIAKVTEHNGKWMERCIEESEHYAHYGDKNDFTGEELRFYLSREVGCPQHSNAWGALINTLLKRKIIEPTGAYRKMKEDASHARKTPVYRKAI